MLIFISSHFFAQNIEWVDQIGGEGSDHGFTISSVDSNTIFVAGYFQEESLSIGDFTVTNLNGSNNMYVARYDFAGNVIWAIQANSESYAYPYGSATDNEDALYITGYFGNQIGFGDYLLSSEGSHDVFIVKIDFDGNILWAKSGGGAAQDISRNVTVDSDGNVIIIGEFEESATFDSLEVTSGGGQDVFFSKYSPEGELLWIQTGGGEHYVTGRGIVTNAQNELYVAGGFDSELSFNGEIISTTFNAGWIAKYSSDGTFIWLKKIGDIDSGADIRSIDLDDEQNIIMGGGFGVSISEGMETIQSSGSQDFFIAKMDSDGEVLWINGGGGILVDRIQSVSCNELGDIFAGGIFQFHADFDNTTLTSHGMFDVFISHFSAEGEVLWLEQFGGFQDDILWGLDATDSHVCSSGSFRNTAYFGMEDEYILDAVELSDAFTVLMDKNTITNISKQEFNSEPITISPNPSNYLIYINDQKHRSQLDYEIRNVLGNIVLSGTSFVGDGINIDNIADGLYFISIMESNELIGTCKIMKE